VLYKPLKYYILYIIFTILISFFGPLEYQGYNKLNVAAFMLAFIVIFILAYIIGIELANKTKPRKNFSSIEKITINILKFSILLTCMLAVWSFIDYITKNGFTIKNLGQAYLDAYSGVERNSGRAYSPLELISMVTGIFKQASLVLGVFYYKKLNKKWKSVLILSWGLSAFTTLILTGKQKFIGDIVIYLISVFAVTLNKNDFKKYKKYILASLLCVLVLFTYIQKQRFTAIGIGIENYNNVVTSHLFMNDGHFIFKIFGDEWGFSLSILLTAYLSGGYYGLSLCLGLPFQWTYGLGHSYSLAVITNRFLEIPFHYENGYVFRMESEYGWPAMSKWHTIFPYLASDLTFIGTLIYFFFIALIYSISFFEALKFRNPLSLMLFSTLNIMLIFVPANNQLMIGPEGYFSLLTIIFIWLVFHKKFNIKSQED
jgi:hypothetical protein